MNRPTVSQADIQKHIEFTNESGKHHFCCPSPTEEESTDMIKVEMEPRKHRVAG